MFHICFDWLSQARARLQTTLREVEKTLKDFQKFRLTYKQHSFIRQAIFIDADQKDVVKQTEKLRSMWSVLGLILHTHSIMIVSTAILDKFCKSLL